MKWSVALLALVAAWPCGAITLNPAREQPLKSEHELLPAVVTMAAVSALAGMGGVREPRYAVIALGKDEYVYSLIDKKFIRLIKDRYELPPWQLCGDWASVRVALLGEAMEPVAPISVWFLAYRDEKWVRIQRDEEGRFFKDFTPASLPPYAVRCFNLDNKDLTDH